MEKKQMLRFVGLILLILTLALTACGGGEAVGMPEVDNDPADGVTTEQTDNGTGEDVVAAEATLTPAEQYPETLALHPDAIDIEANPVTGTYVYIVPMMVKETSEYLLEEMKALGWEELGKPVLMGHLATINMQMGKGRVAISMQDNERSQTTRVQMLLMGQ